MSTKKKNVHSFFLFANKFLDKKFLAPSPRLTHTSKIFKKNVTQKKKKSTQKKNVNSFFLFANNF